MLKNIMLGFISFLSLSGYAASIEEVNQNTLLNMDKSTHILVDVRTPKEYQEGHVPNAINIPLHLLQDDIANIELNKDKTLVLYCRSGYRAGKAAKILQNHGYSKLKHLEGDMLGWSKAKLPIEK
jgi:rhodanese-related sulfurtransferase